MAYLDNSIAGKVCHIPLNHQAITYITADAAQLATVPNGIPAAIAAFYPSKHHFVLLSLSQTPVFVNQCRVSMLKIIREGDHLAIGPQSAFFHELTKEVLQNGSALITSGRSCLVCRDIFKSGDSVAYCPSCHTPHHARCWEFQRGRCANGRVCDYQVPWDAEEPKIP